MTDEESFAELAHRYSREAAQICLFAPVTPLTSDEKVLVEIDYELARWCESFAGGKLNDSNNSRAKQHQWNMGWLELVMNKE